ncbi:MAG: hypothetical protein ACM3JJ_11875 [Hyphomicrobiales bacterium]
MAKPTQRDVEIMLKLYELRREPEMRRARMFLLTEFNFSSWDEMRAHYMTGDEVDRHFRMGTSYWEMVASFVNRGLLDEDLFFDSQGEPLFIWNKIKPVIEGARAQIRPTYLWNLERLARRQQAWRERSYADVDRVIEAGSRLGGKSKSKKAEKAGKKRGR